MAYIVMAYAVMASFARYAHKGHVGSYDLYSHGLYSYGLYSYGLVGSVRTQRAPATGAATAAGHEHRQTVDEQRARSATATAGATKCTLLASTEAEKEAYCQCLVPTQVYLGRMARGTDLRPRQPMMIVTSSLGRTRSSPLAVPPRPGPAHQENHQHATVARRRRNLHCGLGPSFVPTHHRLPRDGNGVSSGHHRTVLPGGVAHTWRNAPRGLDVIRRPVRMREAARLPDNQ